MRRVWLRGGVLSSRSLSVGLFFKEGQSVELK